MIRKIAILSLLVPLVIASVSAAEGDRARRHRRHRRRRVAEMVEKVNSPEDLLRVYVGYARQLDDGTFAVTVMAVWGDLDRQIDTISSEFYANWDGSLTVTDGTVALARKVRFDARKGREPAEGSGVDKLGEATDTQIVWQAGVVGAVDGLMFKINFASLDSSATFEAGGQTVTITPQVFTPPVDSEPDTDSPVDQSTDRL